MDSFETIKVDHRDAVDWVSLNRPESLNSINGDMAYELVTYFRSVADSKQTRIVVLRAEGEGFCSGLDLKSFQAGTGSPEKARFIPDIVRAMWDCPHPIVTLIHGVAIGAGFAFALASDIRIAGESARMRIPFINMGLAGSELGISFLLPRHVGMSVAAELMYTGNYLKADRALQLGLVSNVVPDNELESAATELTGNMLKSTRVGLRKTKELLKKGMAVDELSYVIDLEAYTQETLAKSREFKETISAFSNKKKQKED